MHFKIDVYFSLYSWTRSLTVAPAFGMAVRHFRKLKMLSLKLELHVFNRLRKNINKKQFSISGKRYDRAKLIGGRYHQMPML